MHYRNRLQLTVEKHGSRPDLRPVWLKDVHFLLSMAVVLTVKGAILTVEYATSS